MEPRLYLLVNDWFGGQWSLEVDLVKIWRESFEEEKGEQNRRQGLLVAKILIFAKAFVKKCVLLNLIFSLQKATRMLPCNLDFSLSTFQDIAL